MEPIPNVRLSAMEYLDLERSSDIKHEFVEGEIFAMAGGTPEHGAISANVIRHLGSVLRDRPCQVFTSDVRVRVEESGLSTYPDVSIVCGPVRRAGDDALAITNPLLIVEVTSPSTADWDRGGKFAHYRRLPSLREYLVIAGNERLIEHYVREADGRWTLRDVREGAVPVMSIDATLPLAEVYLKVELSMQVPTTASPMRR